MARPALSAAAPVKVMPLGDSITGGPGCWRAMLWDRLQKTGYTNVDFVGTLPGGGCNLATWDGDNEGHGGFKATGIVADNQLPGWLAATQPDVVLMHLGTNDVWNNIPAAQIITAFDTLLSQMRAANPNMRILVAQIIPMTPPGCGWCPGGVSALNAAIPGWVASRTTAQSPITVVDQYTGFDTAVDTSDGVHPLDSGFQKMSDRWYPALVPLLGGTTTPTSAPATTRSATPTTTRPATSAPVTTRSAAPSTTAPVTTRAVTSRPATTAPVTTRSAAPTTAGCSPSYKIVSQWGGGFQGEVTLTNSTSAATSAWTAVLTFANGQQISQAWNATVSTSGATATAKHLSWNGLLMPGGTATFGFLASWTGTNAAPSVTCTLS
ncbi:cellulose binding domain-containing protein [Luedemannella flava]